ncbi:uncharacterized protein LOC132310286 [Cornus florida]|uniref:uncharacterized protein LOC132310286 n=1 Tax=Cornus florida TaxID=4283 RepID=UPI00289A93AA|nr:uncharacterized protein LOC132310286 [Cornus florida]
MLCVCMYNYIYIFSVPLISFIKTQTLVQSKYYIEVFKLYTEGSRKMSSTSRAWMVAASIAAVEALKDQGFCRWNYTIRTIHQHAKTNLRSFSQAKKLSSSSSTVISSRVRDEKAKQSEESLRKIMYLSCWGPN